MDAGIRIPPKFLAFFLLLLPHHKHSPVQSISVVEFDTAMSKVSARVPLSRSRSKLSKAGPANGSDANDARCGLCDVKKCKLQQNAVDTQQNRDRSITRYIVYISVLSCPI